MSNHYFSQSPIANYIISKTCFFSFLIALNICFFFPPIQAQVIIKTESTPDIQVCLSEEKLEVEIRANATFTEALEVDILHPVGINYVPQSLELLEIPNGLNMEEQDISSLEEPVFQINASSATPFNDGEKIVFSIERDADCDAITYLQGGGTFEDLITVHFASGSESELGAPFSVSFASLAIYEPAHFNAEAGSVVERQTSIINGGLACTNSIRYELKFTSPIVNVAELLINDVVVPFDMVSGGIVADITEDYFSLIGDGNMCFDNGEVLVITERGM